MLDYSGEEKHEKKRHNEKYAPVEKQNLYIEPIDYEKFDNIKTHTHCYTYAVHCLGDIKGKRILDLACGTGWFSVILAKRGAMVEGIDISDIALKIAKKRAILNEVAERITFRESSFYSIDYPPEFFDLIVGIAALHHANDKERLRDSLYRVLKPNGKIIFAEPFGNSRALEKIRLLIPVPVNESDKSHWNEQIKYRDLDVFKDKFTIGYKEFQFFSRLDRLIKSKNIVKMLGMLDVKVIEKLKWLRPYARDIVIVLTK